MALLRAAGLCRLALRAPWAVARLLSSAAGGELPADKPGRRVYLEALRRERALRPPSDRAPPALPGVGFSPPRPSREQVQLNRALTTCGSIDEVLDLVAARWALMNCVIVSTALSVIARLAGKHEPALWLKDDERFRQLLRSALTLFERQEMDAQGFSNILYACGQLGIAPPTRWLRVYWECSAAVIEDFVPQALSNTVYACGQLGITPHADWLESFWQASASKLGDFKPQAYSNTLYASGQLGVMPPASWLEHYWHASALKLADSKPQDFSNTLYACGQLGISPPGDWMKRYWEASATKLDSFTEQGLSNTIYTCGQLSMVPPADWLERYWHASAVKLGAYIPQDFSNTIYACGQLGIVPAADWLDRFWHASASVLGSFTVQGLSNTIYACGQLGLTPPDYWLPRFWHASASKLEDFIPQNFSNTIYACGQLGITPPDSWLPRYWHASASKLGDCTAQNLSNTLYACGLLDTRPPTDWLARFSSAFEQALPDMNQQDFANTALALAMLQLWELPLWCGLWERLCSSLSRDIAGWNAEDRLQAMQMYQAYQAAVVERPGLLAAPSLELLAAARESWINGLDTDIDRTSQLHDGVSACLKRIGVPHANERWCDRAERSIDIAIEGASPVALEVDGPHHFLQDGRPEGSTLLRNRMLAAHGWRVAIVDYRVWEHKTQEQREAYLRGLLA